MTPSTVIFTTASASTSSQAASCTTAVPGRYGNVPADACNSFYNYNPQFAPAVATAVIYGLLTTVHLILAIAFKTRYAWVVIMAGIWETTAFILHALGVHDQQNAAFADGWDILFLLAPLWINAFAYMSLARTVYCYQPDHKVWRVPAVGMSKYFVWADVVTFIVQAVGGIMATPTASPSIVQDGINIYMAGLGCQEFCLLVFLSLMIVFHRDCLARERDGALTKTPGFLHGWRGMLYTLYLVLGLISFRLFYRIAEFAGGVTPSNPVPFHEAFSYAMDALPMAICLLVLAIRHPGHLLTGPNANLPRRSRKEKKAAKAAKKQSKAQARAERKLGLGSGRAHVELQQIQSGEPPV